MDPPLWLLPKLEPPALPPRERPLRKPGRQRHPIGRQRSARARDARRCPWVFAPRHAALGVPGYLHVGGKTQPLFKVGGSCRSTRPTRFPGQLRCRIPKAPAEGLLPPAAVPTCPSIHLSLFHSAWLSGWLRGLCVVPFVGHVRNAFGFQNSGTSSQTFFPELRHRGADPWCAGSDSTDLSVRSLQQPSRLDWLNLTCWATPVVLLWFILIRHLSVEWSFNPQYNYGWVVPIMCVFLAWRELQQGTVGGGVPATPCRALKRSFGAALLLGLVYIPTRLVEEANPDWHLISWLLAFEVVGLTILVGSSVFGSRVLPGPALLILTAVPWPTWVQSPVIQGLGTVIAWSTTEILDMAGSPCVARGSIIEVGSGLVGIEEACSGIRSFQASWMLAIFLVLLYKLRAARAFYCLTGGLVLSIGTNLLRTVVLSLLAAHGGVCTMENWHGLTGTIAALTCFGGVWFLAASLGRPRHGHTLSHLPGASCRGGLTILAIPSQFRASPVLPALLLGLVAVAEFSTLAWYGVRERRLPPPVTWHIDRPRDQAQFSEMELSAETRRMLRYDDAVNVGWTDNNGLRWQAIFLRWNPGGAAGRLARNHTPADCLPAAGDCFFEKQKPHR